MLTIKHMPYSEARPQIRVGDVIGCKGSGLISRCIRLFRGGVYGWSHTAPIIKDTLCGGVPHVMVLEALGSRGLVPNYLSRMYASNHGRIFWIPMGCTAEQQQGILEHAAEAIHIGKKYDFKDTWACIFRKVIPIDIQKFNCSEWTWWLLAVSGRVKQRLEKGVPVAPVPGDLPVWCEAKEIYELDMSA